jgi:protein transport protein SEC13
MWYSNKVHSSTDLTGRYLATTSIEGIITLFTINKKANTLNKIAEIDSPTQKPIWCVKWADPRFGTVFACCSFDHTVSIYKLEEDSKAEKIFSHKHKASLNSLDFAPWGAGLRLVAVGSDGKGLLIVKEGEKFGFMEFECHGHIATSVSWAPACSLKNFLNYTENPTARLLFATAGCDSKICIWEVAKGANIRATGQGQTNSNNSSGGQVSGSLIRGNGCQNQSDLQNRQSPRKLHPRNILVC